jgi:hypothetical protein
MSQFDEVSNIANPTFDAELAISMTVNAKLPKTPQRQSPAAGASDLALDSLDNKIPLEERESDGQYPPTIPAESSGQMADDGRSFKAPQCERQPGRARAGCPKSGLQRNSYGFGPIRNLAARSAAHKGPTAAETFELTAV